MIKIENIKRIFGESENAVGLKDVSLSVQSGEVIVILGPSGCGKSTLLRVLASLEERDSGLITIESHKTLTYVAQDYTLWPHLTLEENIKLAPKILGKHSDLDERVQDCLERFDLIACAHKYPHQLSGGQKQRGALLRAIMNNPDVLLLDEITSALDPDLTKSVLDFIRVLASEGYTMLIVTHHISFAMAIADRVIFMRDGQVIQDRNAVDFFANQDDLAIRSFINEAASKDENIQIFKGFEQFQAYHINLMRRLPEQETIYVVGAVADLWYGCMGDLYDKYEKMRLDRQICWQMLTYDQGQTDFRLLRDHPAFNKFRKLSEVIKNPANYNVFQDTVIIQIFEPEPTIIEIKDSRVARAYKNFFDELWKKSA